MIQILEPLIKLKEICTILPKPRVSGTFSIDNTTTCKSIIVRTNGFAPSPFWFGALFCSSFYCTYTFTAPFSHPTIPFHLSTPCLPPLCRGSKMRNGFLMQRLRQTASELILQRGRLSLDILKLIKRSGLERNRVERNEIKFSFHCLSILRQNGINSHSIIWEMNGMQRIIVFYSFFTFI